MRTSIYVPARIERRWLQGTGNCFRLSITKALERAKVSQQVFQKSWRIVQPTIPDAELFSLFIKAFGDRDNALSRVHFIKEVVQEYKAMAKRVWDACVVFVLSSFPPALCVHMVVLSRGCTKFCPHKHHSLHSIFPRGLHSL